MKKPIQLLILAAFLGPFSLWAQSKVGHVNTREILNAMPEVKVANARFDSINNLYKVQMNELVAEYDSLVNKKDTMRASHLEARIQAFQEDAKADLQKKSDDLLTPIRKKLSDAIDAVAKEEKYTVVFDSGYDALILYVNKADDLTDKVKKRLGL